MCVLSVYGVKLFINFLKCIKKLTLLRDGLKKVPNTEVFRPPSLGHLQFLIRLVKEYFIPYFFLPSGLPQFILFYIISYKRDSIEIGSPPPTRRMVPGQYFIRDLLIMIKDTGGGTILYIYIHPLHNPLAWRGDLFTSKYYWIMDKKVKIGTPQKFVCNRFNPL